MDLAPLADRAFASVLENLAAGRIPGAVLGLVTADGNREIRFAGAAQLVPEWRDMTPKTWFDLASLTKVIFTTMEILALAEAGRIDLDGSLITIIPDLRQYDLEAVERKLTFRACLGHQTHLPDVEPIYTYGADPATLRAFVLQREWRPGPPVYSDINFILLGIALERIYGTTIRNMAVADGFSWTPDPRETAATERCSWRGRVMVGEVHDENCWAMQGTGHAGLFGTVDGVLDFARGLLDGSGASPEVIRLLQTRVGGDRAHGWDLPHPGWSGGDRCSAETIGHTGFTGTGLWLDFERGLAWTLLTNRVHPSRHTDSGIFALRRNVGDIIAEGLAGVTFTVRPYQPGDLAALIPLLKHALELDELRPEAFARDFLMAPGFCAQHLLIAASEAPFAVLGFLLAPRQDPLSPADRGFIAAFGVDPRFQRQGIGRALVARAIADMRSEGLREIEIADVPVRYFVPGIDRARFSAAHDLLTGAGFATRDAVASMGIDASAVHRPAGQGLPEPMRLIGPEDVHLLHDFLVPEFDPAWWAYFETSLRLRFSGDHSPSEIICWMEDGKPLGAVHFRGARFGPVAVGAAARGRGIGANLTLGAIDRMRALGYRSVHFMMATAEVEPFYAKLGFTVLRRFSRLRLTL